MAHPHILQRLADARREIDAWDGGEFSSPPNHLYRDVAADLPKLSDVERASLVEGLAHSDPAIRREAAHAIETLRIVAAADALFPLLGDGSEDVRDAAASALAEIAPERALPAIVEGGVKVSRRSLESAATAAAHALEAGAIAWLERSDADPYDAGKSAWSRLYRYHRAECEPVFARKLGGGELRWVMGISAIIVQSGAGEWALKPFRTLARSADARIREAAARALAKTDGSPHDAVLEAVARARGAYAISAVRTAVAAGRRTQKPIAARLIAATPWDTGARQELFDELASLCREPWEKVSHPAVEEAVRDALEARATATTPEDAKLLQHAIRTATAIGASALAREVVATLGVRYWSELSDAVKEYANATGPAVTDELARAVAEGLEPGASAEIQERAYVAAHLLATAPSGDTHEAILVRALRHGTRRIRGSAADTLRALDLRDEALVDSAEDGVSEAIRALVAFGDRRVVPIVLAHLGRIRDGEPIAPNERYWLLASCIRALGKMSGAEAVPVLGALCTHADLRLRRDAADALGETAADSARPFLQRLLKDDESQVRSAAQKALALLANPREATKR